MPYKITLILLACACGLVKPQVLGEACKTRIGGAGTCKPINDCESALRDLSQQRFPKLCDSNGQQIVCCSNPPVVQKPTHPPTLPSSTESVSVRKCNEYKDAVYENVMVHTKFSDAPTIKNESTCGIVPVPMIVGGTVANTREFPHMVELGYKRESIFSAECGGSLISENFVLTAAHCFNSTNSNMLYARLGRDNVVDNNILILETTDRIQHPRYSQYRAYYDIGLIRLERSIKFNAYIRPGCLTDKFTGYKVVSATGWGRIGFNKMESEKLLKVGLQRFSSQECTVSHAKDRRVRHGIRNNIQLCYGSRTDTNDTCLGDSGGPLQVWHSIHFCMYSIVGITSFGKGCGIAGIPAVYTRVFSFVPWIESIVWPGE